MKTETERRLNNKERVLELLKIAGPRGCSNGDLLAVGGFRYGARLFELRREGHDIETIAGEGGAFTFVLKGRVQSQPSLFAEMRTQ
jgi:hypothetical protein